MQTSREHLPRPGAGALPEPTEEEIQKAAYFLWLEHGRPEGRELDTWLAAKELVRHHHGHAGGLHFPPSHGAQRSNPPFVKTEPPHP